MNWKRHGELSVVSGICLAIYTLYKINCQQTTALTEKEKVISGEER